MHPTSTKTVPSRSTPPPATFHVDRQGTSPHTRVTGRMRKQCLRSSLRNHSGDRAFLERPPPRCTGIQSPAVKAAGWLAIPLPPLRHWRQRIGFDGGSQCYSQGIDDSLLPPPPTPNHREDGGPGREVVVVEAPPVDRRLQQFPLVLRHKVGGWGGQWVRGWRWWWGGVGVRFR